jgi:hypothetical protein
MVAIFLVLFSIGLACQGVGFFFAATSPTTTRRTSGDPTTTTLSRSDQIRSDNPPEKAEPRQAKTIPLIYQLNLYNYGLCFIYRSKFNLISGIFSRAEVVVIFFL